jgi:hypothetical protein
MSLCGRQAPRGPNVNVTASAIGVLPFVRFIDAIARTIFDEIILKGLSDQVIVVRRFTVHDGTEYLN